MLKWIQLTIFKNAGGTKEDCECCCEREVRIPQVRRSCIQHGPVPRQIYYSDMHRMQEGLAMHQGPVCVSLCVSIIYLFIYLSIIYPVNQLVILDIYQTLLWLRNKKYLS